MEILVLIIVGVLSVGINTAVLAVALLLTGEEGLDQDTLLKCFGVVAVATAVSLIPVVGFLSIVVWFVGVMAVFEKSFLETLLIALACWVISLAVEFGLAMLVNMFL